MPPPLWHFLEMTALDVTGRGTGPPVRLINTSGGEVYAVLS